jgi:hypothetical protein
VQRRRLRASERAAAQRNLRVAPRRLRRRVDLNVLRSAVLAPVEACARYVGEHEHFAARALPHLRL